MSGVKIRMKIDDWNIKVNATSVVVSQPNKKDRTIPIKKFLINGIKLFPAKLAEKVRRDLRYANMYDKLIDRIYEQGIDDV